MRRYHLFRDFRVYKTTLRKNFRSYARGPDDDGVRQLLERSTQSYTLEELRQLFQFLLAPADRHDRVRFGKRVLRKLHEFEIRELENVS